VKSFLSAHIVNRNLGILVIILLPSLLAPATGSAQNAAPPSAPAQPSAQALSDQQRNDFRKEMSVIPLPGRGCFEAKYPDRTWKPVQCGAPPRAPNLGAAVRRRPALVGGGTDQVAQVMTGTLSSATGSFDSATGITDIDGSIFHSPPPTVYPNTYTLQVNTNRFPTSVISACASGTGCQGWQQFILSQRSACGTACIYIEYWLFDTPSCPTDGKLGKGCTCPGSPWQSWYDPSGETDSGCFFNTPPRTDFSTPAVADLGKLSLSGAANSGGMDIVTLQTADGNMHATNYPDSTLGLAQSWNAAEFNVFGDCCGYETFLNAGSNLTVRLSTNNGTINSPNCMLTSPRNPTFNGTTAETNNLSLGSCSPVGGAAPAIVFSESGGGALPAGNYVPGDRIGGGELGAISNCPSGTGVTEIYYWNGDTTSRPPWTVPSHQLHCQDANGNKSVGNQIGGGEPAGDLVCPDGSFVTGINYWNGDTVLRIVAIPNHQLNCQNPRTGAKSSSAIAGGGDGAPTSLSCPPGTYLTGIIFWNGDTVSPAPVYVWPWGWAYIPNHQLECRPLALL
jgi:hypothetical protein